MRAPDWRWGFRKSAAPSLQRGAHARVPAGRFQLGPLMAFRDRAGGQAHGGNAGAGASAGGQVTGHGEGLGGQGAEAHLVAPAGEDAPLGSVDPLGVVGEDRLQRRSHALIGGPQRRDCRRLMGNELLVSRDGGYDFLRRRSQGVETNKVNESVGGTAVNLHRLKSPAPGRGRNR